MHEKILLQYIMWGKYVSIFFLRRKKFQEAVFSIISQ